MEMEPDLKRIAPLLLLLAGCATIPAAQAKPSPLPGCAEALVYSSAHNGVALLVLEDGKIRCRSADTSTPQELWSGTKSLVGLMAAAAVQDGLLTLDERAALDLSASEGSEEHTSELQSLMRISYAVFCLKKKTKYKQLTYTYNNN